jgi:hypothetical protein
LLGNCFVRKTGASGDVGIDMIEVKEVQRTPAGSWSDQCSWLEATAEDSMTGDCLVSLNEESESLSFGFANSDPKMVPILGGIALEMLSRAR